VIIPRQHGGKHPDRVGREPGGAYREPAEQARAGRS